ncbi:MAG: M81 family metallopeptidase, partial [Chloroflexi bacterium]|nr:M81 family metallopeptidase [Chloroflexota bacterium]
DAFDRIAGEMLQLLKDRGPWDGVFLAQHGAAVSQYLVMSSSKCWGVSEDFIIYQGSQGRDACLERPEVSHSESPMAFQTDGPKAATPKGRPVVVIARLAAFQQSVSYGRPFGLESKQIHDAGGPCVSACVIIIITLVLRLLSS